ncbi:MAG: YkgJ family cysteine cluster protein [Candidatus Heimdallarchaeota archaeon]|nr:YkgJ family cysteine cluster protein [Candidatus Heimdallarchaeota archaeon]
MRRPDDIGDENWVRCGFRDCYKCCLETEMLLTLDDYDRIVDAGYDPNEFSLPRDDNDGFAQLRNVDSPIGLKCYFLSDKGKCTIYPIAPAGCKLYPLIVNLDTSETMIDEDCREKEWFRKQEYHQSQIISITSLVNTLLIEQED